MGTKTGASHTAHPRHRGRRSQGRRLFEFLRGHDRFLCELRDHGETYGTKARFGQNEAFLYGRRFDRRMDPTRTPRELAPWAEEERKGVEREGGFHTAQFHDEQGPRVLITLSARGLDLRAASGSPVAARRLRWAGNTLSALQHR